MLNEPTPKARSRWARFAFAMAIQLPTLWVGLFLYDMIILHKNKALADWPRSLMVVLSAATGGVIGYAIERLWNRARTSKKLCEPGTQQFACDLPALRARNT